MLKNIKLFATNTERETFESSENYIEDYVSLVNENDSVHYNKPKFFCKLTLNDDSVVELEGSGELTSAIVSTVSKDTIVSAEIGTLCTSIGDYAFTRCVSLSSVTIPNSVTSIGESAFQNCPSLTSVTIPNSVTSIGDFAFENCYGLTSITIENGVTSIGVWTFNNCSGLTSVTIPDSVTSIGEHAFYSCNGLTSAYIGGGSIGECAFYYLPTLTSVTFGNNVTSIGYEAFCNCYDLNSIIIPDSVTEIKELSFGNCYKNLSTVTIGSGITSIEESAFYGCHALLSVTINTVTTPSLGNDAFEYNESDRKIYVPSESVNTYKTASGWSNYANDIYAIPTT